MKISLNWLRDFVDFHESAEEVAEILTFLNFECGNIERVQRHVRDVVIGRVVKSVPHPDADKLKLTKVDIGWGRELPIVCGAPNCREGLLVAVAPAGAKLGEVTIEARKLRGEISRGMILSEAEMGITEDHSGIVEMPEDSVVGDRLSWAIPAEDAVLEFEVTVNRPDALSHLGMARELAAYWKRPLKLPSFKVKEYHGRMTREEVSVEIRAEREGPRYVARKVYGVKIAASPLWMKARLMSVGQRPINNVVDITNYILFELGQPLHAFDAGKVGQGRIVVRLARDGEKFTTLDGKERRLVGTDLMIADPRKGIALAGVMGGANSEISETTDEVIIEAAYFDPPTVRRTAKRLGLSSEASRRFERGADPDMPPLAAARCAELFRQYADATVLCGHVDAYPNPNPEREIHYRPTRARRVLGYQVPVSKTILVFNSLGLICKDPSPKPRIQGRLKLDFGLDVTIPRFRHDLEREIDLIEEIARHAGYDKVPASAESQVVLASEDPPLERIQETAVDAMVALGFREAVTSSMTSGEDQKAFAGGLRPYRIHKPVNPEMNVYRSSLVPGLLRVLEHNLNRGFEDVLLFETGQAGGGGWLGVAGGQRLHLAFVMTGRWIPAAYDRVSEPVDLADVKSVLNELARGLTLDLPLQFSYDIPDNLMHGIKLSAEDGSIIGVAGQIRSEVAVRFGLNRPVFAGEVDLERWVCPESGELRLPGSSGGYQSFSRFPGNVRDVAFAVPGSVTVEAVQECLHRNAGALLEEIMLFDLYQGRPLAKGERGVAFRLVFRASDRTLTDSDLDPIMGRLIAEVRKIKGVRLRT